MVERSTERPKNPHSILRITVEKLFGQFTYELPGPGNLTDLSSLFILYGDNGSGKTTILNLLFHLLSSEDDKGHKTFVSRVRFKRFCVELADGTVIEARRGGKIEGRYTVTILKGKETLESLDLPLNSVGADREENARRLQNLLKILDSLELGLHLLPDDRRIQGGIVDDPRVFARVAQLHLREYVNFIGSGETEDSAEGQELKRAVERAVRWIRSQAYKGSNTGQKNANSIYTNIAQQIAESPATVAADIRQKTDQLIAKLQELFKKSADYAQFGLISELPVERLVASLGTPVSLETSRIMYSVISPYVNSIDAQLKALEGIHSLIRTFVRNLNKFFAGSKTVEFDLRGGFTITSSTGDKLDLEMLSSGEKQLLLLLCNTLAARDRASILIIDEPEISLNIKWQRRLIKAAELDCIRESNVQLIFATHSIELLAQHNHQVVRLENQDAPRVSQPGTEGKPHERGTEEAAGVGSEVQE